MLHDMCRRTANSPEGQHDGMKKRRAFPKRAFFAGRKPRCGRLTPPRKLKSPHPPHEVSPCRSPFLRLPLPCFPKRRRNRKRHSRLGTHHIREGGSSICFSVVQIPSFFMRCCSVERLMPSREAAPYSPPSFPPLFFNACRICPAPFPPASAGGCSSSCRKRAARTVRCR